MKTPLEILTEAGFVAYLCGGCVRDHLLGRTPKDVDIATNAMPAIVMNLLTEYGYRPQYVGESFGVVLCVTPFGATEIATFRKDGQYTDGRRPDDVVYADTAEEDSNRRDFTINAMFIKWTDAGGIVIQDFHDGWNDLHKKVIKTVGDPYERFTEDKLRMLRAIRFACQLDFAIEKNTLDAIRSLAHEIKTVSAERIGNELVGSLIANPELTLTLLDSTGLLKQILPEISSQKGVTQDTKYHPEGDVFVHTRQVLRALGSLPKSWRDEVTVLAALLHDVAKPQTRHEFMDTYGTRPPIHRISFLRHEDVGAPIAKDIVRRLRRSADVEDSIEWIILNHLRPFHAHEMKRAKVLRMIRHEQGRRLLTVAWCDAMGGCRLGLEGLRVARRMLKETPPEVIRPVRLITGHDLIEMGMSPGPAMGRLLAEVEDAQLEGHLTTHEDAISFAEGWLHAERMKTLG